MDSPTYNLSNFRVVLPTKRNFSSFAELRVSPTKLNFSSVAAAELGYPDFICILLSDDATQVAVMPSDETEYALPFMYGKREINLKSGKAIALGHTALTKILRNKMGWGNKTTYRISGIMVKDRCLVFNLNNYRGPQKRQNPLTPEELFNMYPSWSKIEQSFKPVTLALPAKSSTTYTSSDEIIDVVAIP